MASRSGSSSVAVSSRAHESRGILRELNGSRTKGDAYAGKGTASKLVDKKVTALREAKSKGFFPGSSTRGVEESKHDACSDMSLTKGLVFRDEDFMRRNSLDEERLVKLRDCCRNKPLFGLERNVWTELFLLCHGHMDYSAFIVRCLSENPEIVDRIIAGGIRLLGQPLSQVLPGVRMFKNFKNKPVRVYEVEDFPNVQHKIFNKLLGQPVFAPNDERQELTREWAAHTAHVLANNPVLANQILADGLLFLGQRLSDVVAGAKASGAVTFVNEDFDFSTSDSWSLSDEMQELREKCVGKPVFAPQAGCEFVLAEPREWARHVVFMIFTLPIQELVLDGRCLTDIPTPPLPVYNEEPRFTWHVWKEREKWLESYGRRWISVTDFPMRKPEWLVWVTDEQYLTFLRNMALRPYRARERVDLISVEEGYYNSKHEGIIASLTAIVEQPIFSRILNLE